MSFTHRHGAEPLPHRWFGLSSPVCLIYRSFSPKASWTCLARHVRALTFARRPTPGNHRSHETLWDWLHNFYSDLKLDLTAEMDADGYPSIGKTLLWSHDLRNRKSIPSRAEAFEKDRTAFQTLSRFALDHTAATAGFVIGWRNLSALRAHGISGSAPHPKPLYELINFSDREGFIGHEAAAELGKDFKPPMTAATVGPGRDSGSGKKPAKSPLATKRHQFH